jgi:hypothetical protein
MNFPIRKKVPSFSNLLKGEMGHEKIFSFVRSVVEEVAATNVDKKKTVEILT